MATSVLQRAPRRAAVVRIAPFALFLVFIALAGVAAAPAVVRHFALDPNWLHTLRGVPVALVLAFFWREYRELALPRNVPGADWLLAVGAGIAVFLLWISLDAPWMRMGDSRGFDPAFAGETLELPVIALRLFGLVLVVPVIEELFWRSFLMRWIEHPDFLRVKPVAVGARAFVLTAVLFALEHDLWLAGLIAGAVYNGLYMRSQNLWVPIVAHATTNGVLGAYILATASWTFW